MMVLAWDYRVCVCEIMGCDLGRMLLAGGFVRYGGRSCILLDKFEVHIGWD